MCLCPVPLPPPRMLPGAAGAPHHRCPAGFAPASSFLPGAAAPEAAASSPATSARADLVSRLPVRRTRAPEAKEPGSPPWMPMGHHRHGSDPSRSCSSTSPPPCAPELQPWHRSPLPRGSFVSRPDAGDPTQELSWCRLVELPLMAAEIFSGPRSAAVGVDLHAPPGPRPNAVDHAQASPCACLCSTALQAQQSSKSVRSVRIRSTTPVRLLHGFVLLSSRISDKMDISMDTTTIISVLVVSLLSLCLATYHLYV